MEAHVNGHRLRAAHPDFFAALDAAIGAMPDARLRRIDLGKQGNFLAELAIPEGQHWLAWNNSSLEAVNPAEDRHIPLGRLLNRNGPRPEVRILNYRPGRRLTVLDQGGSRPRILKGFRRSRFQAVVAKYEQAHDALAGRGIQAPEIVEIDDRHCCLAMAYEAGAPLRLSTESMDDFHLIGECLAEFQSELTDGPLEEWASDDELDNLDRQRDRHTLAGLAPSEAWRELRERLASVQRSLPDKVVGLCHRDLHDKQFIRHPHFLTLLDFDLLCRADVTLDPANLLAHLRLRQLQRREDATPVSTHVCGKRLLEGLGNSRQAGFWARLRFYQATTFARLALLYTLRPQWDRLTPDLIAMGHRCLDDLRRAQAS